MSSDHFAKSLSSVIVCIFLFSGCALNRNLVSDGTNAKEVIASPGTSITRIHAAEDGNGLKISGSLRRKGIVADIPNYVTVDLMDQNGKLIDQQKVSYYPTSLTGVRGRQEAQFMAEFTTVPPRGATIRISNID